MNAMRAAGMGHFGTHRKELWPSLWICRVKKRKWAGRIPGCNGYDFDYWVVWERQTRGRDWAKALEAGVTGKWEGMLSSLCFWRKSMRLYSRKWARCRGPRSPASLRSMRRSVAFPVRGGGSVKILKQWVVGTNLLLRRTLGHSGVVLLMLSAEYMLG